MEQQARRVPFDRPGELALLLDVRVDTDDDFFTLLQLLNAKALDRDPARLGELARSFAEQAAARAV
jgi:ParB family chromosome partitioning protein